MDAVRFHFHDPSQTFAPVARHAAEQQAKESRAPASPGHSGFGGPSPAKLLRTGVVAWVLSHGARAADLPGCPADQAPRGLLDDLLQAVAPKLAVVARNMEGAPDADALDAHAEALWASLTGLIGHEAAHGRPVCWIDPHPEVRALSERPAPANAASQCRQDDGCRDARVRLGELIASAGSALSMIPRSDGHGKPMRECDRAITATSLSTATGNPISDMWTGYAEPRGYASRFVGAFDEAAALGDVALVVDGGTLKPRELQGFIQHSLNQRYWVMTVPLCGERNATVVMKTDRLDAIERFLEEHRVEGVTLRRPQAGKTGSVIDFASTGVKFIAAVALVCIGFARNEDIGEALIIAL